MSEQSYQINVKRGVTGPSTNTCLIAAYDRISPVTGVLTETYEQYEKLRLLFERTVGDGANFTPNDLVSQSKVLKTHIRRQLGIFTPKNIVETRASELDEFRTKLARLAVGGYRTAVYLDTGGLHAVGVTALGGDMYDIKSTWSPFADDEPVAVVELFEWLDRSPRQRKRVTNGRKTEPAYNIVALPPEPAGSLPPYPHVS